MSKLPNGLKSKSKSDQPQNKKRPAYLNEIRNELRQTIRFANLQMASLEFKRAKRNGESTENIKNEYVDNCSRLDRIVKNGETYRARVAALKKHRSSRLEKVVKSQILSQQQITLPGFNESTDGSRDSSRSRELENIKSSTREALSFNDHVMERLERNRERTIERDRRDSLRKSELEAKVEQLANSDSEDTDSTEYFDAQEPPSSDTDTLEGAQNLLNILRPSTDLENIFPHHSSTNQFTHITDEQDEQYKQDEEPEQDGEQDQTSYSQVEVCNIFFYWGVL